MEFSYRLVGAGWSEARIADGETHAILTASYLSDALGDLLTALLFLKQGAEELSISWAEEPGEYEWTFRRRGDEVELTIVAFPDQYLRVKNQTGLLVFRTRQPLDVLIPAIADGAARLLDEVGEEEYARKWIEHPFPANELRELIGTNESKGLIT